MFIMTRQEVIDKIGTSVKQGKDWNAELNDIEPCDENTKQRIHNYSVMCENNVNVYEAFVKAFF